MHAFDTKLYFLGSEWRLSPPFGLWAIRCWQEDKDCVLVTWTVWPWYRKVTNWASDFYNTVK